jgi:hypothetical protein
MWDIVDPTLSYLPQALSDLYGLIRVLFVGLFNQIDILCHYIQHVGLQGYGKKYVDITTSGLQQVNKRNPDL